VQRETARTILLTSAGSSSPLRLRTCITVDFVGAGNDATESENDVCARAGVAIFMKPFSRRRRGEGNEIGADKRAKSSPTSPRRLAKKFAPNTARALAGLRTYRHAQPSTLSSLLTRASHSLGRAVLERVFVSVYRCGAVPESHRVPLGRSPGNVTNDVAQHRVFSTACQSKCWGGVISGKNVRFFYFTRTSGRKFCFFSNC
jgi:hypothetical protein